MRRQPGVESILTPKTNVLCLVLNASYFPDMPRKLTSSIYQYPVCKPSGFSETLGVLGKHKTPVTQTKILKV
ncbi:hypothetical protein NC99_15590 [Sunxiuqinia dokdonensis]|uniref:Uncharacterized protein n=1 Tax=Sunxiuqinia dokdonensis TaxID=1409788 RepID=A0A0L8VAZ7_9BACT|nr:hypothetical protein NC99_15590 [Sunxiuqinia dokdonensis]